MEKYFRRSSKIWSATASWKTNKTKTKKSSYWRLDDENEDDGDDDDTVWMMTTMMKTIGTLRSNDADDNENVKKTIGLIGKKLLRRCTTLFCTFLSRFCTTTTWKCLISRFMEKVNKQRQNFISLSEVGYGPLQEGSSTIDKVSG